jgi:hypothetical protein
VREIVGKHLWHFPGGMCVTPSAVVSVADSWYSVTLEKVRHFFVCEHVDPFVARATQSDGTACAPITRHIFFAFLILLPCARHEITGGERTPLTVA